MNLMMSFSQVVSGRGFAGEEENSRRHIHMWIFPQPIVKHHDAERIEHLPLVFVDALDLRIENAVGVYRLAGGAVKPVDELRFGFAFRLEKRLMKTGSSATAFSCFNWLRSLIQPSPMASVMVFERPGSTSTANGAA